MTDVVETLGQVLVWVGVGLGGHTADERAARHELKQFDRVLQQMHRETEKQLHETDRAFRELERRDRPDLPPLPPLPPDDKAWARALAYRLPRAERLLGQPLFWLGTALGGRPPSQPAKEELRKLNETLRREVEKLLKDRPEP